MANIKIENLEEFIQNNERALRLLNIVGSDANDMLTSILLMPSKEQSINDELKKLKKISNTVNITGADEVSKSMNDLANYFEDKAIIIIATLNYITLEIEKYNASGSSQPFTLDLSNCYTSILDAMTNSGIFWIALEFLKGTGYDALAFLLAYGTDARYGGGAFVMGDGFQHFTAKFFTPELAEKIMSKLSKGAIRGEAFHETFESVATWANTTLGFCFVAGYTFLRDVATDKGEITSKDWKRFGLDASVTGLSYLGWYAIVGSVGGVPGVILASAATAGAQLVVKPVINLMTGDVLVTTFERNGKEYYVYANGAGPEGTWDIYVNNYYEANNKNAYLFIKDQFGVYHDVSGGAREDTPYRYYSGYGYRDFGEAGENVQIFSHEGYRDYVYNNFENGEIFNLSGNYIIDENTSTLISKDFAKIKNAATPTEAQQYIASAKAYWEKQDPSLLKALSDDGLSFGDYYNYLHYDFSKEKQQAMEAFHNNQDPVKGVESMLDKKKAEDAAFEALRNSKSSSRLSSFRKKEDNNDAVNNGNRGSSGNGGR